MIINIIIIIIVFIGNFGANFLPLASCFLLALLLELAKLERQQQQQQQLLLLLLWRRPTSRQ